MLDLQSDNPEGAGFSTRRVSGVWLFEGRTYRDESVEYAIGFRSWREVDNWLDVVKWARAAFDQAAIFISILGVSEALGP